MDRVNNSACHRIEDTRLDQQPLVSMTGTPKNELNKIRMEMMKRDNNKVAQDGVESTASQLQGGRLVGEVDEAARTCYERVKGMIVYLLYLLYSASVGMKVALSNLSNKEIYERDETNESNKLSSSGGENKSEEEEASKGQESREFNTNGWSSYDKSKSGEYVLSRPPKKPGGKEADEVDTTTTVSCVTASTRENINNTMTNNLEHWKVPTIVRMENVRTETSTDRGENEKKGHMGVTKEDLEPCDVFDFEGDEIGTPYQQTYFTTGKEIRNIEGRKAHDTYMDGYQDYAPRKRKIAKAARKWKAPTNKPKDFKFSANTNQSKPPEGVFIFGSAARIVTETKNSLPTLQELPSHQEPVENHVKTTKNPGHWSRFGKFRVRNKKTQGSNHMGRITKKRMTTAATPKKISPYELRDQELKIEEGKRAKRKIFNWKRRQQRKLEKNTEVPNVSEFLRKKAPKESRNKRRPNTQKQNTNKVVKKFIGTTYISEIEEWCIFCLEKRQQSSSAVMFARFRSNRRYKPGD